MCPPATLLTWNIGRVHLGRRINRMLRHDSRADDRALQHVARVIHSSEAELVALQELASRGQLEQLLGLLNDEGEGWTGGMGPDAGGDRAVAMVMRRARCPARLGTLQLEGVGRNFELAEGEGWVAIGVHFDAFRPRVRQQQAEGLLRFVDSRSEEVVIVAGDLNIDLRYPLHAGPFDRIFMRTLTQSFRDLGRGKGHTVMGRRRLDYIFTRGAPAAELKVLRRSRVPLGDHDPLVVRLHHGEEAAERVDEARAAAGTRRTWRSRLRSRARG